MAAVGEHSQPGSPKFSWFTPRKPIAEPPIPAMSSWGLLMCIGDERLVAHDRMERRN